MGSYQTTITGNGNYSGSVTGTLTIVAAATTFTFTPSINTNYTYNGTTRSITVTPSTAGAVYSVTSGSLSVGPNIGSTSAIVTASGNYSGTGTSPTITIVAAALTATSTSVNTMYNRSLQSFTIGGINGTYTSSPTVSRTNVGTSTTRIFGTNNYSGYVDGTINIYQDVGYVDIFYGGVYDASYTTGIIVPVRVANASFSVTHSVSGPGSADAVHTSSGYDGPYSWNQLYDPMPPGAYVRNTNPQTQGFVVTITASITDPNYGFMSATTSVTVNAYVAPPPPTGVTE